MVTFTTNIETIVGVADSQPKSAGYLAGKKAQRAARSGQLDFRIARLRPDQFARRSVLAP